MKVRRRARIEGVETPHEKRMRVLDEEHVRRRTCVTRRDANGFESNYHEPKEEKNVGTRVFVWDSELRRSVSPVECAHGGRKGVLMILELDDRWDDPLTTKESKAS